jgi:hypothetical protein
MDDNGRGIFITGDVDQWTWRWREAYFIVVGAACDGGVLK